VTLKKLRILIYLTMIPSLIKLLKINTITITTTKIKDRRIMNLTMMITLKWVVNWESITLSKTTNMRKISKRWKKIHKLERKMITWKIKNQNLMINKKKRSMKEMSIQNQMINIKRILINPLIRTSLSHKKILFRAMRNLWELIQMSLRVRNRIRISES